MFISLKVCLGGDLEHIDTGKKVQG